MIFEWASNMAAITGIAIFESSHCNLSEYRVRFGEIDAETNRELPHPK